MTNFSGLILNHMDLTLSVREGITRYCDENLIKYLFDEHFEQGLQRLLDCALATSADDNVSANAIGISQATKL